MIEISLNNLSYTYKNGTKALDNLNIEIKGKRIGIVGQNGSGKTTLLAILLGFYKPTKGNVKINGITPFKRRNDILENFNPTFEKIKLPYGIKVQKFIKFLEKLTNNKKYINSLAEEIGINKFKNQAISRLSSGQEQLVWIFNALVDQSRIPVLDEPFVHLDLYAYREVTNVLLKNYDEYILTSHIPEDVELLTDSIIILEKGKIKWHGSLESLAKENLFEIFTKNQNLKVPGDVIANFGNIIICRCDRKDIEKLMEEKKIMGYKRAGVRSLYAKI